ncbi:hypothetical protein HanXRQr2_Chr01g0021301 [Helianthus annuus]|uniref:Uncharacterized protein n=1 Tax=Helianthus annuus TaxID=4232 RepID=A0A9K3P4G4_HELAN|nr:hypothetical protein HanXRQr2_Chr01g0021301 [Helianthus annuus]
MHKDSSYTSVQQRDQNILSRAKTDTIFGQHVSGCSRRTPMISPDEITV